MKSNSTQELIDLLEKYFSNSIPFVAYNKPNTTIVKCHAQNNDSIEYLANFNQSGFIFSPFLRDDNTILFNDTTCVKNSFTLDLNQKKTTFSSSFSSVDKTNHVKLVTNGIHKIKNSNLSKIVLSRVEKQLVKNYQAVSHFINLCVEYKSAFTYIWFHPKVGLWLGATPETLLKSNGFTFKTMALAGTQQAIENEIPQWNKKEKEEQQIVTNYIVESLKQNEIECNTSETKSIQAGNLYHLHTEISGKLNNSLAKIIKSLHPTPAVCGFPKNEAQDYILKNEGYDREYYTGFLGELNNTNSKLSNKRNIENHAYKRQTKETDLYVNLRSMKVVDNELHLFVGSGITADSNAENEFTETVNKANTIKNSL